MSFRVWPAALRLDPGAPGVPPELEAVVVKASAVTPAVLLVAGAEALASGWAGEAALALAETWSRSGRPTILADISIGEGALDAALGAASEEGVVDLFLFGASLPHLLQHPEGRGFGYLAVGVAPVEPEEVLAHPRWKQLVADAFRTGTSLLLFTPATEPGLRELAERIASVIVLAAPEDDEAVSAVLPDDAAVLARLAPTTAEAGAAAEAAEAPPARGDARDAYVDAMWARRNAALGQEPPAAPQVDPVPGREVGEEELLDEPPVAEPAEPATRRRGLGVVLWILLGAAVGLGIFFAIRQYYLGQQPPAEQQPARAAAPPPAPPPPPEPKADTLPYSVAIAAYRQYARAAQRAGELAVDRPGVSLFISPVMVNGVLRYQILAGPVADSAGAARLMRRLVRTGVKTGASQFDIRPTRWAFLLGEFPTRAEAEARQQQLAQQNIPTYVVELPYTSGPPHFRLYAGAFAGVAEADVMRPLLRGAGAPDSLVPRVGAVPSDSAAPGVAPAAP